MQTTRYFIPGSEWMYFKFYMGSNSSDQFIIEHMHPFVKLLQKKKIIVSFFFIRYIDTSFHIRLRLKLINKDVFCNLFSCFHNHFNPLVQKGLLSDIQICTYQRELERYGNAAMESVEEFFHKDSQIAMSLIGYINNQENDNDILKLQAAVFIVNFILSSFDFELLLKEKIISSSSDSFLLEYKYTSKEYTSILNKKYREYSFLIDDVLKNPPSFISDIINIYSLEVKQIVTNVIVLIKSKDTALKIENLVGSIIHMSMNRLFQNNNRLFEMIIYYFLSKKYRSMLALENLTI